MSGSFKKWRLVAVILILFGLLVGLASRALRPAEPTYKGQPFGKIIDGYLNGDTNMVAAFDDAVYELGTNSLPCLVERWARYDSNPHASYVRTYSKLPQFAQKILPKPGPDLSEYVGHRVFELLGPTAMPHAIAMLEHPSVTVRLAGASGVLALVIAYKPIISDSQVSKLSGHLQDSNEHVGLILINALERLNSASNAVPVLVDIVQVANRKEFGQFSMGSDAVSLPYRAAQILGKVGPPARGGLEALRSAMQSTNAMLRGESAIAIWRITSDAESVLPVLLQTLPKVRWSVQNNWIAALAEMGPRAKAAVPALVSELRSTSNFLTFDSVTNALFKIDPEAAAKLEMSKTFPDVEGMNISY